jgi:hypothetical protein
MTDENKELQSQKFTAHSPMAVILSHIIQRLQSITAIAVHEETTYEADPWAKS